MSDQSLQDALNTPVRGTRSITDVVQETKKALAEKRRQKDKKAPQK